MIDVFRSSEREIRQKDINEHDFPKQRIEFFLVVFLAFC